MDRTNPQWNCHSTKAHPGLSLLNQSPQGIVRTAVLGKEKRKPCGIWGRDRKSKAQKLESSYLGGGDGSYV